MMLLAAPPVAAAPALDMQTMIYVLAFITIAPIILKEMILPFFKWSAARNVANEDATKKRLEDKVDTLSKEVNALEKKVDTAMNAFTNFSGQLTALDNRIAKQGEHFEKKLDEGLADVTTELNRRLSQTLNLELERIVREHLKGRE